MPEIVMHPEMRSLEDVDNTIIQARASLLNGTLYNDDFLPEIVDALKSECPFWEMIPRKNKRYATSPKIQKIHKTARPTVGMVDRQDLSGAVNNPQGVALKDLSDPGQDIKALCATIEFTPFERSISIAQGHPFGDEMAELTDDMITSMCRFLEILFYQGDAATNPLEFNGLEQLIPDDGDHVFTADITTDPPDSIITRLNEIIARANGSRNIRRKITHIFCTSAGALQLNREIELQRFYYNTSKVTAGIQVPNMVGPIPNIPNIPIVTSPYINDIDGGAGNDRCIFYLMDIDSLEYYGLPPVGGTKKLEPQIFDITQTLSGRPLVTKRMALMYGCLYPNNRGESLYKLEVTVPPGTVWNTAAEAII